MSLYTLVITRITLMYHFPETRALNEIQPHE